MQAPSSKQTVCELKGVAQLVRLFTYILLYIYILMVFAVA
jgi:hypothetical protein